MWRTYDLHRPKHRLISVLFPDPRNSIVLHPYQIPHGCIVVFNENALRALMLRPSSSKPPSVHARSTLQPRSEPPYHSHHTCFAS